MNVNQLVMDRSTAREKLRAVRTQLHHRADAEYQQLEVAYRAAADGLPLIALSEAIAMAPLDAKFRPKIAISLARNVQTQFEALHDRVIFRGKRRGGRWMPWHKGTPQNVTAPSPGMRAHVPNGYALVPIVPPDVRGNHSLDTHHILWEVEAWADSEIRATPDRDPLLLKHLGGDLYAVVAKWDLTDLERAIMRGRSS